MHGHSDDQRQNQKQLRYNGRKLLVGGRKYHSPFYSPFMLQFSTHIYYLDHLFFFSPSFITLHT